jgi:hypothetical protein
MSADVLPPPIPTRRTSRRFGASISVIVAIGFLLRLRYALSLGAVTGGDAQWYSYGGLALSEGQGFVHPGRFHFWGDTTVSYFKPPLWQGMLAIPSWLLPEDPVLAQRLFACLIGSATVLIIGLTVRKLAGPIAGLFAAALAAVYPNLVVLDGLLLVESIYGLTIAAILLATYRLLDNPSVLSAAVLGTLFGLAALQRTDSLGLLLILFFPLLWKTRGSEVGPLKIAAMSVLCTLFVVVPWSIYATSTSATLVPIATNARESLVNDNCSETWYGPNAGYWSNRCNELPPGEKGLRFAVRHAESFPRLALQRIGRTFDFYEPAQNARLAALIDGRSPDLTLLGRFVWWMSLPLAIFGALQCRRLKIWLWPLLCPIFLSIGLSVITHGETRFRLAAEIGIIMLAGIGMAQIGSRASTDDDKPL